MLQRKTCALAVVCAITAGWVGLGRADEPQAPVLLDQVLVTGEMPGPSLWKVTHGDHTLWVLGTIQPLPKKLKWKSKQVEGIIAQSQEVITAGRTNVDVDVGFIEGMKSIPNIIRMQRNPDDQTLADVLEPDVYAKWHELKEKYLGRGNYAERLRPVFAVDKLQKEALEDVGLTADSVVWPAVRKAARKHSVKITLPDVDLEVKIDHASQLMKDMVTITFDDRECFRTTIDQLEADLALKMARANAWAVGDLLELAQLYSGTPSTNCAQVFRNALMNHANTGSKYTAQEFALQAKTENERARAEVEQRWLAAVDAALENNQTTFGLLPMYDLVSANGRLRLLRDKGYLIETPIQQ